MKTEEKRGECGGDPAVLSAYDFDFVMRQVAQFYCHPTRGLGIDLYWC
jgi:hypothetical protein